MHVCVCVCVGGGAAHRLPGRALLVLPAVCARAAVCRNRGHLGPQGRALHRRTQARTRPSQRPLLATSVGRHAHMYPCIVR
jgi:hypothetical protein